MPLYFACRRASYPFWGWQKQADRSYALGSTKGQTLQVSVINLCMSAFLLCLLWCLSPEGTFRHFTVATMKALRWVDYSQNYKLFILSGIVFVSGLCFLLFWFWGLVFCFILFVGYWFFVLFCLFCQTCAHEVQMHFVDDLSGRQGRQEDSHFPKHLLQVQPCWSQRARTPFFLQHVSTRFPVVSYSWQKVFEETTLQRWWKQNGFSFGSSWHFFSD